jgi:hypothetical protein
MHGIYWMFDTLEWHDLFRAKAAGHERWAII